MPFRRLDCPTTRMDAAAPTYTFGNTAHEVIPAPSNSCLLPIASCLLPLASCLIQQHCKKHELRPFSRSEPTQLFAQLPAGSHLTATNPRAQLRANHGQPRAFVLKTSRRFARNPTPGRRNSRPKKQEEARNRADEGGNTRRGRPTLACSGVLSGGVWIGGRVGRPFWFAGCAGRRASVRWLRSPISFSCFHTLLEVYPLRRSSPRGPPVPAGSCRL